MKTVFPFSAIVGQDAMLLALTIAAVDPTVGGVLVFGDRGTGKSTAVRALAAVLPPMQASDCAYRWIRRAPAKPARHAAMAGPARRNPRPFRCRSSTCRSARPKTATSAPSISSAR